VHRRTAGPGGLDPLPDGDCAAALLLAREPDSDMAPSRLSVTPATTDTEPAAPNARYARFGWLAPLVAACETVRPPDGVPAGPVRVPGWHGYVVEPVLSGSAA
jgi:hypothetical protein